MLPKQVPGNPVLLGSPSAELIGESTTGASLALLGVMPAHLQDLTKI